MRLSLHSKQTYITSPHSSELVLRARHSTLDGIGTLMVWDSLLHALTSPRQDLKFGDETSRLAPAVEEVLGHPDPPRADLAAKGAQLALNFVSAMPGIGPVSHVGTGAPSGASRNIKVVLPQHTTASIIRACETKGISVTAAVHAAYIRTLSITHADPHGNQSQYVSAASLNFRSFLPEPYNSSQYAFSVFYQPWGLMLDLPASFVELAQQLNTYYKTSFRDEVNGAEEREVSGSLTRALRDIVQTPDFLSSPVSRDALVSSLGVTEKYLQREYGGDVDVTVRDLKFGIDVVLGQSMFFIYSFREQLRLVYCFNEGFEEPKDIQRYLDGVEKVLVEELLS